MACVVAVFMLSLDIFAAVVIVGILFLIYCFIGFNCAGCHRNHEAQPVDPSQRFYNYLGRLVCNKKESSNQSKMLLVAVSKDTPLQRVVLRGVRISRKESLVDLLRGTTTEKHTHRSRQVRVARRRFLITQCRRARLEFYSISHTRYVVQPARR
jgi:hypothetical protein